MSRLLGAVAVAFALAGGAPEHVAPARAGIAAVVRRVAAEVKSVEHVPEDKRPAPVFEGEVMTDVRDVRACLPAFGGEVLAATGGGLLLVRADGTARAPWTALDGLPETRVHALLREDDRIWIGTEGGLASARIHGDDLTVERSLAGKPVRALLRHEGKLFAATWGGGVAQVDERKGRLVALGGAGSRFVDALAVHEGALFAGGSSGLYRVTGGKAVAVDGAPTSIWALAPHDGRLWIGGLTGLSSMGGGTFRTESDADVRALAPEGRALLAGTFGQGAVEVRDGHAHPLPGFAGAPFVQAVGASGGVRCAGTSEGILVQRGEGARWEAVRVPELPSNDLSALARDGDRLWIGTFDRGLAVLEGGRVARVRDPAIDDKVNGIAVERRAGGGSRVWVATARGLARIDPGPSGTKVTRYGELDGLPSGDVHAVVALSSGGALAGTGRGAAIVRDDQVVALGEKRGIPPGAVWAVAEGPERTLLLGTSRGLLVGTAESRGVVDRGAPVPQAEPDPSASPPWLLLSMASGDLLDDWVTALASRGRVVYAGTYNAGVTAVTMDVGGFSVEQLGGGYVNFGGLLAHGRTLYAATMNGLLARPLEGEGAFEAVPRASPGKDVTAIVPWAGKLWVASRRGLSRR